MNRRIFLLCLLGALSFPVLARAAEDEDLNALIARIQTKYESVGAFEADFRQVLTNAASSENENRFGKLFFKKPNLIRWETEKPEKELFVANEKEIWEYHASEKTAYKYALSEVLDSKTMLRFISGQSRLDKDFFVKREADEDGLIKLDLMPREPEPGLVQAYVWVDPKSAMLQNVQMINFYGSENKLFLQNLKLNPKLAADFFSFTPPKDTEIFDNLRKSAPVQEKPLTQ